MVINRIRLAVPVDVRSHAGQLFPAGDIGNAYTKLAPAFLKTPEARSSFSALVKGLHGRGITFTYSLDETCFNNLEWTRKGQKKLRSLLNSLVAAGVDAIAVSMPFLAELIKKQYPSLCIEVSLNAEVDTIQRARRWEDAGADLVTLASYRLNRNFALLKAIRSSVKCALSLVANHCCLNNCINHGMHANFISHMEPASCCGLKCLETKERSGFEIISSQWIRPEDIVHYEEAGINRLQLLADVSDQKNTLRIIEAYNKRRCDGDLLDLFYGLPQPKQRAFMNNAGLGNFLEHFLKGKCRADCAGCGYCQDTAEKLVVFAGTQNE